MKSFAPILRCKFVEYGSSAVHMPLLLNTSQEYFNALSMPRLWFSKKRPEDMYEKRRIFRLSSMVYFHTGKGEYIFFLHFSILSNPCVSVQKLGRFKNRCKMMERLFAEICWICTVRIFEAINLFFQSKAYQKYEVLPENFRKDFILFSIGSM